MPARSDRRDFHAVFQGAHGLLLGASGIVAIVAFRRPQDPDVRIPMFIGWVLAAGLAWGGWVLVRRGWHGRAYRSALRWVLTIPLSVLWLVMILLLSLLLYIRVTGQVPGFVQSAMMHLVGGHAGREVISTKHVAAPAGWKRTGDGTFDRGLHVAVVIAYDNNGSLPDPGAERAAWVAKLLRGSIASTPTVGSTQSRQMQAIAGQPTWRYRKQSRAHGRIVAYDNYVVLDTKHDRTWNVIFAISPRQQRGDTTLQRRFIAGLTYVP